MPSSATAHTPSPYTTEVSIRYRSAYAPELLLQIAFSDAHLIDFPEKVGVAEIRFPHVLGLEPSL